MVFSLRFRFFKNCLSNSPTVTSCLSATVKTISSDFTPAGSGSSDGALPCAYAEEMAKHKDNKAITLIFIFFRSRAKIGI